MENKPDKSQIINVIASAGKALTQDPVTTLLINGQAIKLKPLFVGTMYRISSEAVAMPKGNGIDIVPQQLDGINYILSLIIKNNNEVPELDELKHNIASYNAVNLFDVLASTLGNNAAANIKEHFIDPSETDASEPEAKSIAQKRRESLPHTALGSFCKYFKTTLNEVLWNMSWDNMILMLSSIEKAPPQDEYDENGNLKPKKNGKFNYPVKEAWEIF